MLKLLRVVEFFGAVSVAVGLYLLAPPLVLVAGGVGLWVLADRLEPKGGA